MRKLLIAAVMATSAMSVLPATSYAQGVRRELDEHPRLLAAIHNLEDAVAYLQSAPHDFGGHKVRAIELSRGAIAELRAAAAFRARMDRR